ncbi:transcriptional regulator [Rhodoblastus sphagnicola]|uniref:Transcriptional regulator n=1 Tax=Rhodoblastus sphagnicola TaxID=333368 RepID=A0A2S6NAI2_9HYPH|nr:LysR substrate-binding domain-containing protein [Rhodoblastus sphagnicola]MBB4199549.1 DNA-binding transcriptional LysR family regulator [Rhodoblastus sphagnicola]PPQ31607.1 transcriptional regulator [Rhodoblastus sphagnicola]
MRRLPPLNALRVFDAAARCLNFSAAAAELCVTHSAVSHQMRQLEAFLGCALFVRHAGGVRLTAAGERLRVASFLAFDQLERCCAEISAGDDATELTLGAPGSFLANWLIPRLAGFEVAQPDISLHLRTCGDLEALEKRRVDALILSGRDWPRVISAHSLFEDAVGPVCVQALADGLRQPADLAGRPLLHTKSHPEAWPIWAATLGLPAAGFDAGRRFDHLALMLEAAASGLGVGIAPALLVAREIESGRLVAPFGFAPCGASFAFCTLRTRAAEPGLRALRQWLEDEAGGRGPPAQTPCCK